MPDFRSTMLVCVGLCLGGLAASAPPGTSAPAGRQAVAARAGARDDRSATRAAPAKNRPAAHPSGSASGDGKAPAAPAERTAVSTGAAERNENVQVNRIDTNAAKEVLVRLGDAPTLVDAPTPARSYYGAEHGKAPAETPFLPGTPAAGWHATLFEEHRNSVFNARTFFQVGPVKPSRSNSYGVSAGGRAGRAGYVFLDASQRKVRGMVNGNVLVPLPSERQPRTNDPALRAVILRMLAAYKPELPNRPDFDPRALNTNSPQRIDENRAQAGLEHQAGRTRLAARYSWNTTQVDAFQFVAGQNPDTTLHSHRARLTLERPAARGTLLLAAGFDRLHSLLAADPAAFPARVRFGFQIEELGPQAEFPIDRVENAFRGGVQLALPRGSHRWTLGADVTRLQYNGREAINSRGYFQFSNNFGRSALDNFLEGRPSSYEVTLGEFTRGFRNIEINGYAGDSWKATPGFQINYGVRYNLRTTPREVNGRTPLPFGCDCNNVSPRFGFAYRLRRPGGADYGAIRANYTISYGEIFNATYGQGRLNPPETLYVQVTNPSLLDPLAGAGSRTGMLQISPDLVAPYAHQYNFVWERELLKTWKVHLAYLGSRTFKLFSPIITNRARPVADLSKMTTATVNERRPDPRYYEIITVNNAGIAYYDAAQARVELPYRKGLSLAAVYTFSKAIDTGTSYVGTAAGADMTKNRSQSEFDLLRDRRGLSDFDSPHSLLVQYSYDIPLPAGGNGLARRLAGGWQISGATLLKAGTPLTLFVGSDAPGFGNVDGGPSDRPNIVDPSILGRTIGHPDTSQKILRRAAFSYIRLGESRGNLGRNSFRKGGINNWNAAMSRTWRLPGAARVERTLTFRAEAFNLTNHAQFDEPQRNLTSPSFGQITNTLNDGRVFQFVVRLAL